MKKKTRDNFILYLILLYFVLFIGILVISFNYKVNKCRESANPIVGVVTSDIKLYSEYKPIRCRYCNKLLDVIEEDPFSSDWYEIRTTVILHYINNFERTEPDFSKYPEDTGIITVGASNYSSTTVVVTENSRYVCERCYKKRCKAQ